VLGRVSTATICIQVASNLLKQSRSGSGSRPLALEALLCRFQARRRAEAGHVRRDCLQAGNRSLPRASVRPVFDFQDATHNIIVIGQDDDIIIALRGAGGGIGRDELPAPAWLA
jgi:hypothetical protein